MGNQVFSMKINFLVLRINFSQEKYSFLGKHNFLLKNIVFLGFVEKLENYWVSAKYKGSRGFSKIFPIFFLEFLIQMFSWSIFFLFPSSSIVNATLAIEQTCNEGYFSLFCDTFTSLKMFRHPVSFRIFSIILRNFSW